MSDVSQRTEVETVSLIVNGREIAAPQGQLVIDAADTCGVYIPRFCYHPRMRPVGMCRMCIVDIDTGRGPSLQPACMIPVAEGMKVDTESAATTKAQDGVLEFLLINHPLDCPVCDKGGECPLQDQAYAYGPGESRFVEEKRHFPKPVPISDLVYLDRERCILCDRCTRFAKEVAGDTLIHFLERGNDTEVNTFPDHPFASYFSGNTVQICPVGALTAKPFRFRARPWDLEQVESTCTACSVGCRMVIQSSRNRVLRYMGVDVDPVNWGWLCDKGRFVFEAINAEDRLGEPLVRKEGELVGVSWAEAIGVATEGLRRARRPTGAPAIGIIGGARLTNESAYAWAKLAKGVLGTDNVDCQLGDGLPAEVVAGLPHATIDDACRPGGTLVVLGPDLKEELPVLFLRVRHAVENDGVTVVELSPTATSLTPLAARSIRYRPGEAHVAMRELLDTGALGGSGPVACLVGRPSVAESPAGIVEAIALLLEAVPAVRFLPGLRRANVHGAIDMGLAPGMLPGRVTLDDGRSWFAEAWDTVPPERGLDTAGILAAAADGRIDTLVLLGSDPLQDFPDRELARRGLAGARTVIAADCFLNESAARYAHVVLPVSGYAETSGSTTNLEGRVTLLERKVTPPGTARDDWVLATDLAYGLGADLHLESIDDVWAEIERVAAAHSGVSRHVLRSPAARDGVVVPMAPGSVPGVDGVPVSIEGAVIPASPAAPPDEQPLELARPTPVTFVRPAAPAEAPAPDNYSLRLVATRKLYDRGTLVSHAPSLAGLAPGSRLRLNPADADRVGVADGASVKVSSARGSTTMPIARDPSLPAGVAALHLNQPGADPAPLIDSASPVTEIRVESL